MSKSVETIFTEKQLEKLLRGIIQKELLLHLNPKMTDAEMIKEIKKIIDEKVEAYHADKIN